MRLRVLARWADATVHVSGILFAAYAAPRLLYALDPASPALSAVRGYCLALCAMLVASAAFHLCPVRGWKVVLRRLDHVAIYLKIAASFALLAVLGGADWLAPAIWSAAGLAAVLRALGPVYSWRLNVVLYLVLSVGSYVMVAPALAELAPPAQQLAQTGGVIYLAGVVFFLWTALPFQRAIWHAFVLAATVCVYSAVLIALAP